MPDAALLLRTAVHEAAHAVLGHVRGQFVREAGLAATSHGTGTAHTRASVIVPRTDIPQGLRPSFDASIEMECAVLLAGYVAERRHSREKAKAYERPWCAPDYESAKWTLETYLGQRFDAAAQHLVTCLMEDFTRRCLRRTGVWGTVTRLAEEIVEAGGELDADRSNALLNKCLPGPWMPDGRRRDARPRAASVLPPLLRSLRT